MKCGVLVKCGGVCEVWRWLLVCQSIIVLHICSSQGEVYRRRSNPCITASTVHNITFTALKGWHMLERIE